MTNSFPASAPLDAGRLRGAHIVDADGQPATLVALEPDTATPQACVRLANGMQMRVPLSLIALQDDGSCRLPFAADDTAPGRQPSAALPLHEETLEVGKRQVDSGRGVRLRKQVSEHIETVAQTLGEDVLSVERVALGQMVDPEHPPAVREEGDMLVVPVLEEVLVVQKQLRLREELRIRRGRQSREVQHSVPLRSEQVEVERFDEQPERGGDGPEKQA